MLLLLACSPPPAPVPDEPHPPAAAPAPVALPDTPLIAKDCGLWYLEPRPPPSPDGSPYGGLGLQGSGLGGGGSAQGLGGLGTRGLGSGASGYGSGGGSFGSAPAEDAPPPPVTGLPNTGVPAPEWGAEIHLSNDDSMSLASAQRVLWAAETGARIEPRQVRPHELLNYFHFGTAEVPPDRTFSVRGSALADVDGKLTLALSVKGAEVARRPLDLTFVVDRSGSMSDEGRMDFVKRGLQLAVPQLVTGDRLDLVLFDHEVCTAIESFVVGRDDRALLDKAIAALEPRGATNLEIGLAEGYRIANGRAVPGRDDRVVLITDALVNEGELDPNVLAQTGTAFQERGIRLTGIGVGRQFSDVVLDKLTEAGHGPYLFLGSERVVDRFFGEGFAAMTRTLAHDVRFSIDLPDSLAQERFYGEESSTVEADITPIDYQSGNAQLFLQDLAVRDGLVRTDPVTFRIRWADPATGEARTESWTATLDELLASSPVDIYKARTLMAWADMAYVRASNGEACGEPLTTFRSRLTKAEGDAEVTWLAGLTDAACGSGGAWSGRQAPPDPLSSSDVTIGKPTATGLAPEVVSAVFKRFQNQFRYCYQRVLVRDPSVSGDATMELRIGGEGAVDEVSIASSTVDSAVTACVQGRIERMMFPAPKTKSATVKVGFTFRH